ncbi:MAG TPA: hypothetical protein VKX28_02750 [Xanthobacteraceae bacterium]|nr:hypothetical protein [Xanthobacteraceae bacterium]
MAQHSSIEEDRVGKAPGLRAILVLMGLGILCLSFWITLIVIDTDAEKRPHDVRLADIPMTYRDGSPRSAHPSKTSELPRPPSGFPFRVAWDGIEGMNALDMGPGPIGGGNLAVSLVATRDKGLHRIGIAFVGVPVNRPFRATAWIKGPQGTRISVDVRDGTSLGQPPRNSGISLHDLSPPKVLTSNGNVHASVEPGPSNWTKISIQMTSSDGVFVMYVGLLGPGNTVTFSGAGEQMIFGGIQITVG